MASAAPAGEEPEIEAPPLGEASAALAGEEPEMSEASGDGEALDDWEEESWHEDGSEAGVDEVCDTQIVVDSDAEVDCKGDAPVTALRMVATPQNHVEQPPRAPLHAASYESMGSLSSLCAATSALEISGPRELKDYGCSQIQLYCRASLASCPKHVQRQSTKSQTMAHPLIRRRTAS